MSKKYSNKSKNNPSHLEEPSKYKSMLDNQLKQFEKQASWSRHNHKCPSEPNTKPVGQDDV